MWEVSGLSGEEVFGRMSNMWVLSLQMHSGSMLRCRESCQVSASQSFASAPAPAGLSLMIFKWTGGSQTSMRIVSGEMKSTICWGTEQQYQVFNFDKFSPRFIRNQATWRVGTERKLEKTCCPYGFAFSQPPTSNLVWETGEIDRLSGLSVDWLYCNNSNKNSDPFTAQIDPVYIAPWNLIDYKQCYRNKR